MRRVSMLLALASAGLAGACAAVTGLGSYEIVDCLECGASSDASSNEAAPTDGARDAAPILAPDGSEADSSPPAPSYTPDCARSSCGTLAPSDCTSEPCSGTIAWQRVEQGGNLTLAQGECRMNANRPASSVHVQAIRPGGRQYHFELRTTLYVAEETEDAVVLSLTSGATSLEVYASANASALRLCVRTGSSAPSCGAAVKVPNLAQNNDPARVDVWGRWGDAVAGGEVHLAVGASGACSELYALPIPGPASGGLTGRVGCVTGPCETDVDEIVFIQRPY